MSVTADDKAPGAATGRPGPARALLRAAIRARLGGAAGIALCSVLGAGAALALPAALGSALDRVLAGRASAGPLLLCAGLIALAAAVEAAEGLLTGTANARTTAWLRTGLLRRLLAAGPVATRRFPAGDLVARLVGGAAQAGTAPAAVAGTAAAVLAPLGGLVALVVIDWRTALVFAAGLPVLALLLRVFIRETGDSAARYLEVQGDVAARLREAVAGARTIDAAGTHAREAARILAPLPDLAHAGLRMWRVNARSTAQAAALLPLLELAVLAVAGLRVADGALSVGELLACWRYAVLAAGIGSLTGQLSALARARAAAGRLAEPSRLPVPGYGSRSLPDGSGTLDFRGVTVRLDGRAVLRDVDLTVPGGAAVAIVGRSGSGKSALAATAGRLLEPDTGTVLLDAVPLTELSREKLREAVTYAFERPVLLGGTVEGTIALGGVMGSGGALPEEGGLLAGGISRTDGGGRVAERVREPAVVRAAARAARAEAFIARLPHGYGTQCAALPLSGGERQRLGLARAFTRTRARLLILDDALSSLDAVTEAEIREALRTARGGATRLVTTHRAETAAAADLVVWLDGGRVQAVGPHAELWQRGGYREVFGG
ncbi:ABC transporter transmembrane domain-containing protein [Streptomyces boninensis]|uniref:ABC transporter transmembrane domain-containing protein n=1 Tax=Streptomyces boninensis TaxID=2039455 RepID=UPI003B21A305